MSPAKNAASSSANVITRTSSDATRTCQRSSADPVAAMGSGLLSSFIAWGVCNHLLHDATPRLSKIPFAVLYGLIKCWWTLLRTASVLEETTQDRNGKSRAR